MKQGWDRESRLPGLRLEPQAGENRATGLGSWGTGCGWAGRAGGRAGAGGAAERRAPRPAQVCAPLLGAPVLGTAVCLFPEALILQMW